MATCRHIATVDLRPPRLTDAVYREDCTLCFDSIDDPAGLDVCLHCFNGGCAGDRAHSRRHAQLSRHPLAVNITRTRKRKPQRATDEPPEKISKLEIRAETEDELYDTATRVRCLECDVEELAPAGRVGEVVEGILKANTFARQEEVKAWQLELQACEHTLMLQQEPAREIASGELGHCNSCDLNENLWLCLTCGNLGCGRRQFGGTGGNNHGVEHTQSSKHPVAVKLGSLTAEGNADIYCYECDEERIDPELVAHLANWHIDISGRVKTEKSMAEMNLEQNLNFDFSMTDADGRQLRPLFGPGLTGLKNLGNTCYFASVVQSLFDMPEFSKRYFRPDEMVANSSQPAEDLEVQLRKLADGLLSGRYSKPDADVQASSNVDEKPHQKGITPSMLKHLVGRGHEEFSTSRQQDSFELLLHLLKLISRSQQSARGTFSDISDPVDAFRFTMEQKLQCLNCKRVRYRQDEMENVSVAVPIKRISPSESTNGMHVDAPDQTAGPQFEPVTLKQCFDIFTASEVVELTCPSCHHSGFTKQTLFKTFPTILAVNARRFEIVNWVPTKQDVPVIVQDGHFNMDAYRTQPKPADEELLPDNDSSTTTSTTTKFNPNEPAMEMLTAMGFPAIRCEKALRATGNADAEAASNWLFEHMDDPDIDAPIVEESGSKPPSSTIDPAQIESLANMGFSAPQARQALKETSGDVERAVDWLFSHPDAMGDFGDDDEGNATAAAAEHTAAPTTTTKNTKDDLGPAEFALRSIVCHKGSSIHAGHYVAFINKGEEGWVLFNDEKVALGGDVEEMKKFAYIYFFRRTGS